MNDRPPGKGVSINRGIGRIAQLLIGRVPATVRKACGAGAVEPIGFIRTPTHQTGDGAVQQTALPTEGLGFQLLLGPVAVHRHPLDMQVIYIPAGTVRVGCIIGVDTSCGDNLKAVTGLRQSARYWLVQPYIQVVGSIAQIGTDVPDRQRTPT